MGGNLPSGQGISRERFRASTQSAVNHGVAKPCSNVCEGKQAVQTRAVAVACAGDLQTAMNRCKGAAENLAPSVNMGEGGLELPI